MKYTLKFAALTLETLLFSGFYWLNVAIITALTLFIVPKFGLLLTTPELAEVAAGQLVYTMLSAGTLLVLMFAQPVFLQEKQQRTMLTLLCSPAGAGEILAGKCLALAGAALLGGAVSLLVPLCGYPVMLKAMASLKIAAALGIVTGMLLAYALLVGTLLFCASNAKYLYPALFMVNAVIISAQKHTRGYMETHGLSGSNWLHLVSLLVLCLLVSGIYAAYFSRQRIALST